MKAKVFAGLVSALALCAGASHAMTCEDLLPGDGPQSERDIDAQELIGLRDIGPAWMHDPALGVLSVSPDGRKVAFPLRRAKAAENDYCQGIVVLDLRLGAKPKLVNSGGRYLRIVQDLLGVTNYPSGYPLTITPKWSPDSRRVAFLRADEGHVQAWVADVATGASRAASAADFDVESVDWSEDGKALLITGRPELTRAMADIEAEGRSGFLFDERWVPFAGNRPFPFATVPVKSFSVGVASGQMTALADGAVSRGPAPMAPDLSMRTPGPDGRVAWVVLSDKANVVSPARLHAAEADRKERVCADEACLRPNAIWWTAEGEVLFQRKEGWGRSLTGLYLWAPRTGTVRQLVRTEDVLVGCQVAGRRAVCTREGSSRPRELVTIDLVTGREQVLFNPNPEFKTLRLGPVERLHWKNSAGIENYGDLVLPPDHVAGQKHPLVIVQYESRGFLRGGTGDDFPIHLFAKAGLAVLRVETPVSSDYLKGAPSYTQLFANERIGWRHRREIQSGLEEGIKLAVSKGVVDGDRVGITGYSDGGQTVRFALINSRLFKAAAVSGCCEDQTSIMSTYGLMGAAEMRAFGYPGLTEDGQAFWAETSTRRNAAHMDTPTLIQVRDNEYLASLESYMSLHEQGKPVEMYVYPHEYHQIWQPIHRQAMYQRNVDWFRFWLLGEADTDPAKAAQYRRWEAMKAGSGAQTGATPGQ